MAFYNSSDSDVTRTKNARILVAGANAPQLSVAGWNTVTADGDIADAVRREFPDIVVLSATSVDVKLAALLAEPLFAELPILLLAGNKDADAAGLLLERQLRILDAAAPVAEIEQAIAAALQQKAGGKVADGSGIYEAGERLAALKRDAERVAAALNELAEGRQPDGVRPVDAVRIRAHIRARRMRERFFPTDLFADPVWDMLLDLAAARLELRRVSVSSLCIAANVPTTTGLRWIKAMVDRKMLERSSDPADARRSFIAMTEQTALAMDGCLEAVLNSPGQ